MAKVKEEKKSTALSVVEFSVPALSEGSISEAWSEEMDGLKPEFERVKIPSGGGLAFEVPGDDPDEPDMVKVVEGVIVDHYPVNAFWKEKYTGQGNPPDCSSRDGKVGIGDPGGSCKTCPYGGEGEDAWDSARELYGEEHSGKACKNMRRVFLYRDGDMFPLLIALPPTSVKPLAAHIQKIITRGMRSYHVVTKVALTKAQSKKGIAYSKAQFTIAGVLSDEQRQQMEAYVQQIRPLTRDLEILDDEYVEERGDVTYTEDEESVM